MDSLTIVSVAKLIILAYALYQAYLFGSAVFDRRDNIVALAKSTVDTAIGKSSGSYFSEDNLKAMMSKYGLMYMLHDYNLDASTFVLIKGMVGIGSGIVATSLSSNHILQLFIFIVVGIIGFYLPDEFIKMSNASDNANMIDDIVAIYTSLKIYTKSNVHITTALIECQRMVSNKRLKEGLAELNNNILSGMITTEDAVDLFNSRFCNDHIDNLCVIIKQSMRTGHASEILSDITKQIDDTNRLRSIEKKKQMQRKTTMLQVTFFICVSAIALYVAAMEMMSAIGSI